MKLTQSRSATTCTMSPDEQRAAPAGAPAPEADRAAREVAAEPDQLALVVEPAAIARPELDAVARPQDVRAVGLVQQDPRVEALGPVDHRPVVVGVRDRDRVQPACGLDRRVRRVVDEREAVPEQAAAEQGALPDRERGLDADADETRLGLLEAEPMGRGELGRRRPRLSAVADVLALVEADRAAGRRRDRVGELAPAGGADGGRHGERGSARRGTGVDWMIEVVVWP